MAAGGGQSLEIATEHGDGLFVIAPEANLVSGFCDAVGTGSSFC